MNTKKVKEALEIINDAILEINDGETHAEDFYWWGAVLNIFDYDVKEGRIIPCSERTVKRKKYIKSMTANEIKILEEIRDKYCQWGEVGVIDNVIEKLLRYDIGSGVIIPDVEMPKNCHECDCCGLSDIVDLKCPCDTNKELYSYDKRPEECPLKLF